MTELGQSEDKRAAGNCTPHRPEDSEVWSERKLEEEGSDSPQQAPILTRRVNSFPRGLMPWKRPRNVDHEDMFMLVKSFSYLSKGLQRWKSLAPDSRVPVHLSVCSTPFQSILLTGPLSVRDPGLCLGKRG